MRWGLLLLAAMCWPTAGLRGQETGRWVVQTGQSKMDDSETIFVWTRSNEEIADGLRRKSKVDLQLRCYERKTSVILNTEIFLTTGDLLVRHRVDRRPAQTLSWAASTDHSAIGLWYGGSAIPFIKGLFKASDLIVEFTPYGERTQSVAFDVSHVEEAVTQLRKTCRW